MKTDNKSSRSALPLVIAWLLFSAPAACEATSWDAQSPRGVVAGPGFVQPVKGAARLIIIRIPTLGYDIVVQLWIDGVPATAVGYGHTYEALLAPGRHILSVLPAPNPRWRIPWQLTLDAQSGQIYGFTAMGDGSGHLVLDGRFGFPVRGARG
jgi:hypothetical protein